MLVTLVLLVFGVMLFDMRGRLKAAEQRLAQLEGGVGNTPSLPDRPVPEDGDDDARARPAAHASVVERRVVMDGAPPRPARAVIVDRHFKEGGKGGEEASGLDIEGARHARPPFRSEELFGRSQPIWAGGGRQT